MLGRDLQKTMRRMAGAAMLAAVALPTSALAPELHLRGPASRPSHEPVAPRNWRAAERVYMEVAERTRGLELAERTRVARTILAEAAFAGLDPILVVAMIQVESSFKARAVSRAGAVGLMQLRRPTMREVASRSRLASASPRDPVANVQAGTRYLAELVRRFDDVELALMAYNAGPDRIRRFLRAGRIPERFWTYPRKVNRELGRLRGKIAPHLEAVDALLASAARAPGRRLVPAHAPAGAELGVTTCNPAKIARPVAAASAGGVWSTLAGAATYRAGLARAAIPTVDARVLRPEARSSRKALRHARRAPLPAVAGGAVLALAVEQDGDHG